MSTNAGGISSSPLLVASIERCHGCAEICLACAHTCMDDPAAYELRSCIRMNFDCADTCMLTLKLLSGSDLPKRDVVIRALDLAIAVCRACAEECETRGSEHACCREAAAKCHRCVEACTRALQDVGGATGVIQTN